MTTRSASETYLVDTSGWLEYLTEDSKAAAFGHYLEGESPVIVPALVLYDVYRYLAKQRGRTVADRFLSQALHRRVVPLDETIAIAAANASIDHRLSSTDAIVYATARVCQAQLVTANTHFRGLPGIIIP
ncbi:MAG TPA: type II toxin-antitoxin system VapC family toxin [Candidatus Baltobacteraceae bacterium]|nr:type II toxin-antitoxin system VapC family toxin [Candidatus Baltobacteraceae bacterium]